MTSGTIIRPAVPISVWVERTVAPVLLLTLNVPFAERAVEFAIDTAAEVGAELYVCDAIPLGYGTFVEHTARRFAEHENRRYSMAVAERARERGVRVTQMVFHNPKPIKAALEVVHEHSVGLLVFGSDREHLGRWTFRRAARRLRENASCLVWTGE